MRKRAYFGSLGQRLGFLPASFRQTAPGAIWLHAVSVGEAITAVELVRRLRELMPRSPVFVSVSTLAGHQTASQKLRDIAPVFYAPLDYVFAVRRVLRLLRPSLVIVMETEIWPNLFRETKRTGAGLTLINGRISDHAFARYQSFSWFFGPVLAHVDVLLAQTEEMRERFIRIGASPDRVTLGGNLKYDAQLPAAGPDSPVRQFIERLQPHAVWIAASTMPPAAPGDPDENDAVIAAFQLVARRDNRLLLILAPRKPEYFDQAAEKLRRAGVPFVRRSELGSADRLALPGVLLLDSIGELSSLFSLADVVFMGGTLASRGGHNILEPALAGKPVISGPHMENFSAIAADFRTAGALVEVRDTAGLADAVIEILSDPQKAAALAARARSCALAKQGATEVVTSEAYALFARCLPRYRPAQPGFTFLWVLSRLWIWGGNRKRKRDLAHQRSLDVPVISVGNITAGGTGKTPVVLFVAERLRRLGWKPGILTRGYGRQFPHGNEALPEGAKVPVDRSGDEPQIFLRSGVAPVGIGADRWHTGVLLEHEFGVNVLLLDDGFQHARLQRWIDIVLIDGMNPSGGGYPIPLGRLREPCAALSRADLFIITRSDFGRVVDAAESALRRHNPRAPVFHARVRPEAWVHFVSEETVAADSLPFRRVGAFCGLGNPESFWGTLAVLGLDPVDRLAFDDHHRYRPRELRLLAQHLLEAGAEAILTTEKDMLNLCEECGPLLDPLPLYWLRISVQIDREEEFLRAIVQRLEP